MSPSPGAMRIVPLLATMSPTMIAPESSSQRHTCPQACPGVWSTDHRSGTGHRRQIDRSPSVHEPALELDVGHTGHGLGVLPRAGDRAPRESVSSPTLVAAVMVHVATMATGRLPCMKEAARPLDPYRTSSSRA